MCNCVFCNKDKIVTDFVYEDDLVMAFMDINPINEGHILIATKKHYLDIDEIPDEELSQLIKITKKIVKSIKRVYCPDGYSIMQNGGNFNDVGHFHLHVFPRYKNDGFNWNYSNNIKDVNSLIAKRIKDSI